jgi:uncharacterized protein (DUF1015 family)
MIGTLQAFLESYTGKNGGEIDYIHDGAAVRELASQEGNFGIIMPAMDKSDLFKTVIRDGVFPKRASPRPRKDKRYYLECRKIK